MCKYSVKTSMSTFTGLTLMCKLFRNNVPGSAVTSLRMINEESQMYRMVLIALTTLVFVPLAAATEPGDEGYPGYGLGDWAYGSGGNPDYGSGGRGYGPGYGGYGRGYGPGGPGYGRSYPGYGPGEPGYGAEAPGYGPGAQDEEWGPPGYGRGSGGRPSFQGKGPGPGYGERGQHRGYGRSRSEGRGRGPEYPGAGPRQEYFRQPQPGQ